MHEVCGPIVKDSINATENERGYSSMTTILICSKMKIGKSFISEYVHSNKLSADENKHGSRHWNN